MSISLFAPLLYLLVGLGLSRVPFEIKGRASAMLTKWVIPSVIIYNIATHRSGVFAIMLGMIAMMGLMLLLSRVFTRDPVKNLCFCYLNIGWLGLPIASTLFGDGAAMVIIAAYVGSSLFGNSVGVGLMAHGQDLKTRLRQTIQAPPVWALLLGLACIPFGGQIEHYAKPIYDLLKFLMGFLGMAILGIWLSATPLKTADFKKALLPFVARLLTVSALTSLFILVCEHYDITLVTENKPALYLIGLLPPAANIIVLETHYMKSGRSASMIACGTCLSIIAIGVYVGTVLWLHA
ncbi:AEC family transporter [Chromobacterium sphagni]|uniref:Permease n=1 Tax=Chromobacterium sphagni TaxID=1903179 RepID=A0A1S1WST0_9NEIS|nr:permease [Chromobacterium sphagni]OHX10317.1 permease [Chromobacterium sphagni]OHX19729.1 permease [Chromobacterium sphagni]